MAQLIPAGSNCIPNTLRHSDMTIVRHIRRGSSRPKWLGGRQAARFPLRLVSSQPRHKLHSQMDAGPVSARGKIAGREALVMNPEDARARGIEPGEVVRVFNARGACFAGAVITQAVRPGVLQRSCGAWYAAGRSSSDVIRQAALFGTGNRDGWDTGLTILTALGQLLPFLSEEEKDLALFHGARRTHRWRELDSSHRFLMTRRGPCHGDFADSCRQASHSSTQRGCWGPCSRNKGSSAWLLCLPVGQPPAASPVIVRFLIDEWLSVDPVPSPAERP
jgi:hypothetical protein